MAVKHFVVVEPDEVSKYADMVNRDKLIFTTVLPLDMRFVEAYETLDNRGTQIGKGPGGARNFCWQHSMTVLKRPYHWVSSIAPSLLTQGCILVCLSRMIFRLSGEADTMKILFFL